MKNRIVGVFVALLLALTGALSLSEAAVAEPIPHGTAAAQMDPPGTDDPPGYDCPYVGGTFNDAFCLYDNDSATGKIAGWYPAEPRNKCLKVESSATAAANSLYNRTNYVWRVFRTKTCGGSHQAIPGYTYMSHMYLYFPPDWHNTIVAVSRTSTIG